MPCLVTIRFAGLHLSRAHDGGYRGDSRKVAEAVIFVEARSVLVATMVQEGEKPGAGWLSLAPTCVATMNLIAFVDVSRYN